MRFGLYVLLSFFFVFAFASVRSGALLLLVYVLLLIFRTKNIWKVGASVFSFLILFSVVLFLAPDFSWRSPQSMIYSAFRMHTILID